MEKSESLDKLGAALVLAMEFVKPAQKDAMNPFYKKSYADLTSVKDAVDEALRTHDLAVTQLPDHLNGAPALTTMLVHKSGQYIAATYPLSVPDKDQTSQGYGSALTYARRYGLSAVLGVVADDDDGNAASGKGAPSQPRQEAPAAKPDATKPEGNGERKMSPQQWGLQSIELVKTLSEQDLSAWGDKYAAALVKLNTVAPDIHGKLVETIRNREAEVGGPPF